MDKPAVRSKAEMWRTVASITQVVLAVITLCILVYIHFIV